MKNGRAVTDVTLLQRRERHLLAVLELQINACAAAARDLSAAYEPEEALSRWMQLYIDLIAKKRGFASALHSGNSAYTGLAKYFLEQMRPALNGLLASAVKAKVIRRGVAAEDILRAVVRLCHGPQGEEPAFAPAWSNYYWMAWLAVFAILENDETPEPMARPVSVHQVRCWGLC